MELKTTKLEFPFYVGEFDKLRSTIVLKALAQEVEEHENHLIVKYDEDNDTAIYQFMLLLMENDIVEYNLYIQSLIKKATLIGRLKQQF